MFVMFVHPLLCAQIHNDSKTGKAGEGDAFGVHLGTGFHLHAKEARSPILTNSLLQDLRAYRPCPGRFTLVEMSCLSYGLLTCEMRADAPTQVVCCK
ncbi:hypothetical protein STEG23_022224, partial [Scotinomys teguina]